MALGNDCRPLRAVVIAAAASTVAVAATTGATAGGTPRSLTYRSLVHLYDYDAAAPLGVRQHAGPDDGDVKVFEISFRSPRRGRVDGYLLIPSGHGRFPAVVWMGGLDGSKDDMRGEAADLAHVGVAGLLLDAVTARPPYPRLFEYDSGERDAWIRNIIDVRRGIDFLATRPDIDLKRLGYVGFSFGADTGTIVAAVDHRFKAVVIASGGATQLDMLKPGGFFYRAVAPRARAAYISAAIDPFEPKRYAAHLAPAAVFFQHGTQDPSFSRANQRLLDRTASSPKKATYYNAGHELNAQAVSDRKTWLLRELGAG
jgi:dienelactone hydrolase